MTFKPQTKTINLMLLDGGIGDGIAALTAVDYILKQYPWITPLLWVPDYLVSLCKHLLPDDTPVYGLSEMKGTYQPKRPTKTTSWDGNTSPMKIHCLDYAFLKLCDENPSIEHKNYLQIKPDLIDVTSFSLPKKYVVITTGYTASVREFKAEAVNELAKGCKEKGFEVVFLGQRATKTGVSFTIKGTFDTTIDYSQGLDLIDKTNLLEAAKIMHLSQAVLGVDNGLLHLAGCTDVKIIGGFTTVSPEIRMPVRNNILGWNYYPVTPDQDLSCKFCQQKTNFLYGHDYKNCIYKNPVCTDQMTADKFLKALEII